MSTCCKEYADEKKSMIELVFAPCEPSATATGAGAVNWMAKTDADIFAATMVELGRLFPNELGTAAAAGAVTVDGISKAQVLKYSIVRTPRSVYAAVPGRNKYRPSQRTPGDASTWIISVCIILSNKYC